MHLVSPRDGPELDDRDLERLYEFPADRQWLVVNFVASADGAVEVGGTAGALGNPADRRVYELGSDLADVVLVGATTAVRERFNGVRQDPVTARRRRERELHPVPPVAVVTSGRSLPPDAPVITEARRPPIVLTCASAPARLRAAWAAAGAEVAVHGGERVDLGAAVDALGARGLRRIDCEGGPRLHGRLLAAGLVDELRLTVSPMLAAGWSDRVAVGTDIRERIELASALQDGDTLLLRYLVRRP